MRKIRKFEEIKEMKDWKKRNSVACELKPSELGELMKRKRNSACVEIGLKPVENL